MRRWLVTLALAGGAGLGSGACVLDEHWRSDGRLEPGQRVPLRFHIASAEPIAGWNEVRDEYGQVLYVAPEPFLDERDVVDATALHSPERSIVILSFFVHASFRLAETTAENIGKRMAVFVDDRLVVSPRIAAPVTEGQVALDVGMSRREAERILRGYVTRSREQADENAELESPAGGGA